MIVHAADAHLGITRYSKIDPETGQNLRGQDFLSSFNELCDFVIETRPDLVLFSGDLFDRVNPTNYVRRAVQKRLQELSGKAIDTVLISGNHEMPRSRGVSNPLILYRDMPHIRVILAPWSGEIGTYHVTAVPFMPHPQEHIALPQTTKAPVLMMHTSLQGAKVGSERFMCFDDDAMAPSEIPPYEYVALGHIHQQQVMAHPSATVAYAGSLERYDFNEIGEKKGFYLYDGGLEHIPVTTRPMASRAIVADDRTGFEITQQAIDAIDSLDSAGMILRLEITGILDEVERGTINYAAIREHGAGAAYLSIMDRTVRSTEHFAHGESVFSPVSELERYLKMTGQYSERTFQRGTGIIDGRWGR